MVGKIENILDVKNLFKNYGDFIAIDYLSFSIKSGEIVGLLGPNGAGKTTTIGMILGLIQPTSGMIYFSGGDIAAQRHSALHQMNFAAAYATLPGSLKVWENLYIFALLHNVLHPRKVVEEVLRKFRLEKFADEKLVLLSSGQQMLLNLAKSLINRPKLLLLDEPTASLDPDNAALVRIFVQDYAKENGAGVLWTSHDMQEIEAMCDRVLFLLRGRIIFGGEPKELLKKYGKNNLEELFIAVARKQLSFYP